MRRTSTPEINTKRRTCFGVLSTRVLYSGDFQLFIERKIAYNVIQRELAIENLVEKKIAFSVVNKG